MSVANRPIVTPRSRKKGEAVPWPEGQGLPGSLVYAGSIPPTIEVPVAIMRNTTLSRAARLAYVYLSALEQGRLQVSTVRELGEESGFTQEQFLAAMKELRLAGFLVSEKREDGAFIFDLPWPQMGDQS